MEKLINCPLCNNTDLKDFLNVKDFFLSKEDFIIQECKKCGFRFLNPRPESVNLQKYYNSEEYVSHSDTSKGLINKAYHIFRYYNLSKKYKTSSI